MDTAVLLFVAISAIIFLFILIRQKLCSASVSKKTEEVKSNRFDLSDFWEEYDGGDDIGAPVTDQLIAEIEKNIGYKLPLSYIALMKNQNGGYPRKTCVPLDESIESLYGYISITSFFAINRTMSESQYMIDEWEYPKIGVYICHCPSGGHDMVALDYRKCGKTGEPEVVHVYQGDDDVTFLASTFEEFILSLKHDDEYQ